MKIILLATLLIPMVVHADSWMFLTQVSDRDFNIVKGLTKDECEAVLNRTMGYPTTREEKKKAGAKGEAARKKDHDSWCADHYMRIDRYFPEKYHECLQDQVVFSGPFQGTNNSITHAECFHLK